MSDEGRRPSHFRVHSPAGDYVDRVVEALHAFDAANDAHRLAAAIEAGEVPASTTINGLTPEQQVWFLDRDPLEVGLPADFGMADE